MNTSFKCLALLAATGGLCIFSHAQTIRLNPDVSFGNWQGWGTSLCWWANIVGGYPTAVRADLMQKVFGELKFNIVRYNIGGGENPNHHHIEPRALMPSFEPEPGRWDWSADKNQRWVLQHSLKMGVNITEAFSNSPPYWMTLSKCASGNVDGKSNLDPKFLDAFADYLVKVTNEYRTRWGITFGSLEPMNEPDGGWWKYGGRQEGCDILPGAEESAVFEAVEDELKKTHSHTPLVGGDWSGIDSAAADFLKLSPAAQNAITRINAHAYWGTAQARLFEVAQTARKQLWMSEYGDGDATGMKMAHQIVRDISVMHPTAWVYWQAIDQGHSGWGMLDMDMNAHSTTYFVNRKFYVMQQFTNFLKPGCRFISVDDPNTLAAVYHHQLIVVTVADKARTVQFSLAGLPAGSAVRVVQTSASGNFAHLGNLHTSAGGFSADVPADSVTTFVVPMP